MPGLYRRASSAWAQVTPGHLWAYNRAANAWNDVKKLWVSTNGHIDPALLTWVNTWVLLADFTVPTTETVPGVAIAKAPSSQITYGADVSWTAITSTSDNRYGWNVVVFFTNITTGDTDIHTVAQTAGTVRSKAWAFLDQVHADVFYTNNSTDGPHTTTSTVTLGP